MMENIHQSKSMDGRGDLMKCNPFCLITVKNIDGPLKTKGWYLVVVAVVVVQGACRMGRWQVWGVCDGAQKLVILKGRDRSRSLAKCLALWP